MDWLHRIGWSSLPEAAAPSEAVQEGVEGAAPGVAALLEGLAEDRDLAVLDLGRAAPQSLRIYGRIARWVRFADLVGEGGWPRGEGSAAGLLRRVAGNPEQPYDIVLAWDILDRLFPEDRPRVVACLTELTAPDARIHVAVHADQDARPLRFTLLDTGRIRYEPATGRLPRPRLLPADVASLLVPFRVVRGFTLRSGLREYVALRSPE